VEALRQQLSHFFVLLSLSQAIACERAGEFFFQRGDMDLAENYLGESLYGYVEWEAGAKAAQLSQKYPNMLSGIDISSCLQNPWGGVMPSSAELV
jgi:hypothetical protein